MLYNWFECSANGPVFTLCSTKQLTIQGNTMEKRLAIFSVSVSSADFPLLQSTTFHDLLKIHCLQLRHQQGCTCGVSGVLLPFTKWLNEIQKVLYRSLELYQIFYLYLIWSEQYAEQFICIQSNNKAKRTRILDSSSIALLTENQFVNELCCQSELQCSKWYRLHSSDGQMPIAIGI